MRVTEFVELAESWERHLRASGAKPTTISVYLRASAFERRWLVPTGQLG